MSVYELRKEELDELKDTLYTSALDVANGYDDLIGNLENLDDDDIEIINNCLWHDDIPDKIVFKAFEHISFVEEDFFCNCNDYAGLPILE